jgi:hypothetical protein
MFWGGPVLPVGRTLGPGKVKSLQFAENANKLYENESKQIKI